MSIIEEVKQMPRRDGTGPLGSGPATGRGMGPCVNPNGAPGYGNFGCGRNLGRGCGRGFRRPFDGTGYAPINDKAVLEQERNFLKAELDAIEKQLKNKE